MAAEVKLEDLSTPKTEDEDQRASPVPGKTDEDTNLLKSKRSKIVLLLLGFIGLVCLVVLASVLPISQPVCQTGLNHDFDPSCGNETICNIAAKEILQGLNTSVDPCDNFYEFACGSWNHHNPIPDPQDAWGPTTKKIVAKNNIIISILEETQDSLQNTTPLSMAKDYFRECVAVLKCNNPARQNRERQLIWEKLEQFGGWPILYPGNTWNSSRFDWIKSVIALKKEFDTRWIFDVKPYQVEDPAWNYIGIAPPDKMSPALALKNESILEVYKQSIVDIIQEVAIKSGNPAALNEANVQETATKIALTTKRFEELKLSWLINLVGFRPRPLTVEAMQEEMIQRNISVDLLQLLNRVYNGTGIIVEKSQLVDFPGGARWFAQMVTAVSELGPEAMANFLHFQMARKLISISCLNKDEDRFLGVESGIGQEELIHQSCIMWTTGFFREALIPPFLGQMGIRNFSKIETMFENIVREFWQATHKSHPLVSKYICQTKFCISHDTGTISPEYVQSKYGGISWNSSMHFMEQELTLNNMNANNVLKEIKLGTNMACPWSSLYKNEYKGMFTLNKKTGDFIYLGTQELAMPFYHVSLPRSLIYGHLGYTLGHEIAHGLDDTEFGGKPCLRSQYSAFKHTHESMQNISVDGHKTLAENFADNAGMHAAYAAYLAMSDNITRHGMKGLEKYSNEQLFFIGFAQRWCSNAKPEGYKERFPESAVHAPDDVRVLGTLRNSEEFAMAWKCSVGTNMNPAPTHDAKRCKIW